MRTNSLPCRIVAAAALAAALAAPAGAQQFALPRVSQKSTLTQTIGTTDLSIVYHRPGVKGRAIWGALVPFDKPWRTGANDATQFTTTDEIKVEGQTLPAGTYAFLTIPGKDQWTVVFSKQKEMWGAFDYLPEQDQLRVSVKPEPAEPVEWMEFTFDDAAPTATVLSLRWEKLRVPVRIEVDVNAKVLASARTAVAAAKPDDWRTPYRAANWCVESGASPDDAARWADAAWKTKENFFTLSLLAKLSQKAGRRDEAVTRLKKALTLAKDDKDVSKEQLGANEKLLADWVETAPAPKR